MSERDYVDTLTINDNQSIIELLKNKTKIITKE